MRADRLLALLMLLQTRGKTPAAALARELEVSERTIYRDVLALSSAGVPIYSETGRSGGVALVESYRTSLTGLKAGEVRALLMLNIPQPLHDLGLGQDLQAALLKLQASLPDRYRADESRLRQRLLLDSAAWELDVASLPALPVIQQAIWEDRTLRIGYNTLSGIPIEHSIEPYALVAKGGAWYLVFARLGHWHTRRLSSLVAVQLEPSTFTRQDFDLPTFWAAWCDEQLRNRRRFTVRVCADPSLRPYLGYYFGAALSALEEQPDTARLMLSLSFDSFEEARSRLLGLGGAVEVLSPPELRRSIQDFAEQICRRYSRDQEPLSRV